jgi:hypothetical protein
MTLLLLKAVARLVEMLLMAAIALLGIGVGLYCLSGLISLGSARPDRLLHLPLVRHDVGHFLVQLAAPGPVAVLALLCGIGVALIGLLLIVGLLRSRRERLLLVEHDEQQGDLYARPRAVSGMVRDVTLRIEGVTSVKRPTVRHNRDGGHGRVKVLASRGPDSDSATVDHALHEHIDPITGSLHLKGTLRARLVQPRGEHERARRGRRRSS